MAGDTIFAKFCQDALSHILRHPRSIQTRDVVGMGWEGSVWVEMDGDGWRWLGWGLGSVGWVRMGVRMGAGGESCGQEMVLFTFQLHFSSILRVFGWVLGVPGLRLGSDWASWFQIDALRVTFSSSRPDFGWAWEFFEHLWGALVSI